MALGEEITTLATTLQRVSRQDVSEKTCRTGLRAVNHGRQ